MQWSLDDVRPALVITDDHKTEWQVARDLLTASALTAVLEVDNVGTAWLRFAGDPPPPDLKPRVVYAVGNGSAGNVGAGAINRLIVDPTVPTLGALLTRVSNPMPASGGTDPETIERVRQRAPVAFRSQLRCITPQDYADRAATLPDVQRAFARLIWTGSWHTVFLYLDRIGGQLVDAAFADQVRAGLEPFRMMGHDLEIRDPVYVPLDMTLTVCLARGVDWHTVRDQLGRLFGGRVQPDGTLGLFHPDRLSFGEPIYTGPLLAAAQAVPGVVWADLTDVHTLGTETVIPVADGQIMLEPPRIPRLDNDPDFPDHGTFRAVQAAAS